MEATRTECTGSGLSTWKRTAGHTNRASAYSTMYLDHQGHERAGRISRLRLGQPTDGKQRKGGNGRRKSPLARDGRHWDLQCMKRAASDLFRSCLGVWSGPRALSLCSVLHVSIAGHACQAGGSAIDWLTAQLASPPQRFDPPVGCLFRHRI